MIYYIMRRDEGEKLKIREHRDARREIERERRNKEERERSTGHRVNGSPVNGQVETSRNIIAVRLNSFVRGRQIQRI